jgi:hypothetical protein
MIMKKQITFFFAAFIGSVSYGQTQMKNTAGTPSAQIVIVTDELDCYVCRTSGQGSSSSGITSEITSSIHVYPNPANANVNVNISLEQDQRAIVQIYDFSGKLVLERSVPADSSPSVFSTAQLNQGIYLYNVQIDGVNVKSGKLSVIH